MIELKVYNEEMRQDIKDFYYKCFSDLGWDYEPNGRHFDTVNIQESYMSNGCMWCLYNKNQLIGTVAVRTIDSNSKTAELKRLYVLKEYQGQGYGNMLFQTALDFVKRNNYTKVRADTQNDRSASRHLMQKYGFYEISKYNKNPFAELYFELELSCKCNE